MSEPRFPCITYFRQRESERRANHFARVQQCNAEDALLGMGYKVMGRFGDSEFAPPFYGFLEPRPAWQLALDAAVDHAVRHDGCALIVLRSDGIGSGDPFLPDVAVCEKYAGIDIRLCHFSLREHVNLATLQEAHKQLHRFAEVEKDCLRGTSIDLGRSRTGGEILLRQDARKSLVRAYYTNSNDHSIEIKWRAYSRELANSGQWPRIVDQKNLRIPARKASYLSSFIQGNTQSRAVWWWFEIGNKRLTKSGNVLLSPSVLGTTSISINWTPYEPDGLNKDDFNWESAPSIETPRLSIRNWRTDDQYRFAAICRMSDVMRFLGGEPSDAELYEEAAYYASLGLDGQTFWVVERKSDQEMLGFCGLIAVEDVGSPVIGQWEIGWRLRPDAWGQGYAFEAALAVMSASFKEWGLSKIIARIHPRNDASRRLAERLGMCENKALRHMPEGEDQFLVVYEIDAIAFCRLERPPLAL